MEPTDKKTLNFRSAGMKRADARDSQVSKGRQFGIGNFFGWAMEKYPQLTLGQLEQKMPGLEREYAQEKAMRKAEPDMVPSVNAHESKELNRLRKLSGLEEKADPRTTCHSKTHDCATLVIHPKWGEGKPMYESHAVPTDEGYVAWYDVEFAHGIEKEVPAQDMEIITLAEHGKVNASKKTKAQKECKECKGKGCDHCNGTGYHAIEEAEGDDCEKCRGTGMLDRHSEDPHKCNACDGKGKEKWKPAPVDFDKFKKTKKKVSEDSVEKDVIGHVDNEADMLRKELFKMGKYSVELYKMLDKLPDGDFPHWWQSKIVKAGEYLSSAKHYLEGELYAPEEESPLDPEQDDINPSGV